MAKYRLFTVWAMSLSLIFSACQNETIIVTPDQDINEFSVTITADPESLPSDDPDAASVITAIVTDENGKRVGEGIAVTFSTTIGTISPSAVTNRNGQASAILRPDDLTGDGEVYGFAGDEDNGKGGHANILVADPRIPVFIEVTAFPSLISVYGSGGNNVSAITATVRNALGGPVMAEREVLFELLNEARPPLGSTINGRTEQADVSITDDGVAIGYLIAGTLIGGKLVRVSSEIDDRNRIEAIVSNVAVVSGPAAQLEVDVYDFGYDAGGGLWMIEASARVWDRYRNPVVANIAVVFTVEPQNSTITSGWTGNENRNGLSTPGVAYAQLLYNSVNTFDLIEISAEVRTEGGLINDAREHILPLQRGNLELHLDPANWKYEEEREEAEIRCWVVLSDGHGIRINNAPILFTSTRAQFGWMDLNEEMHMYYPDPVRKYTGVRDQANDERPGQATVYLIAEEPDIFLDPFTLEVRVNIEASIEGYSDVVAEPKFITFTRAAN